MGLIIQVELNWSNSKSSELIYKECEAARIEKYQSVMQLPGLKASTVQSAPHDTPRWVRSLSFGKYPRGRAVCHR